MKPCLLDTDILSLFFRGNNQVAKNVEAYLRQYDAINLSIITYYEIISGLKYRDAHKQLDMFLEFVNYNTVLPLTENSVSISGDIYAELRKKGTPVDDIDLLIAGVALANDLVLVTHNQKHFGRIERLEIVDWTQDNVID